MCIILFLTNNNYTYDNHAQSDPEQKKKKRKIDNDIFHSDIEKRKNHDKDKYLTWNMVLEL